MRRDDLVTRLRALGCVFAEAEADLLLDAARDRGLDLDDALARRGAGTPVQQIVGQAQFAGVAIELGPGVFVPRPRAESVVEVAGAIGGGVVVDLGCGSGALAAAVAERLPEAEVHACDNDPVALAWARRNAAAYGFVVHEGDWWSALPEALRGEIDLAVAYLPHVPSHELAVLHPDFRAHEPAAAVDGGLGGLEPIRTVLGGMGEWMAIGGSLLTLLTEEQSAQLGVPHDVLHADDGDVVVRFRASARW